LSEAHKPPPMPEISAFVASLREAFGANEINDLIRRGRAGEPDFFAAENGREFGTRAQSGLAWDTSRSTVHPRSRFSIRAMFYLFRSLTEFSGVRVPETPVRMGHRMLHAVAFPSKDQRQQNGRFLHTVVAASVGGAVGYAHSTPVWSAESVFGTVVLASLGVLLWAMGFLCMKGD
jgi:hypothetical protein